MNTIFFTTSIHDKTLSLVDQEAVHCALVLRKKVGDIIQVIDGKGNIYKCGIDQMSKRTVLCTIIQCQFYAQTEQITIAVAPTKNRDRLEWMIEKLVEIGVSSIILLQTTNTERNRTNFERLEKKAISAVKQSLRFYIPPIKEMEFEDLIKQDYFNKFIAHCHSEFEGNKQMPISSGNTLILIGPEGDFTEQEVKLALNHNFISLNLGAHRLRTETAAIVAVAKFQ